MNKIKYILIAVLAIVVSSCTSDPNGKNTEIVKEIPFSHVLEFKYKGHDYIKFKKYNHAGVVHSPDCKKCYNKK